MLYKVKLTKPQAITTYRVYFDNDTGRIQSITNKQIESKYQSFEVPVQEVEGFVVGTRNMTKHKVVFDVKEQRYKIVSDQESIHVYVDDHIFQINALDNPQIIVEQDIENAKWIVRASDSIKQSMSSVGPRLEEVMFFSITEYGNPNILYNHFYVSINDVVTSDSVEFDFTSQEEYTKNQVSVYTNRKFDIYSHEVINE